MEQEGLHKEKFEAFWAKSVDQLVLDPDIKRAFYHAWLWGYGAGMESVLPTVEKMDEVNKKLKEACVQYKDAAERALDIIKRIP